MESSEDIPAWKKEILVRRRLSQNYHRNTDVLANRYIHQEPPLRDYPSDLQLPPGKIEPRPDRQSVGSCSPEASF